MKKGKNKKKKDRAITRISPSPPTPKVSMGTVKYRVISGENEKKFSEQVTAPVYNINKNGVCIEVSSTTVDDLHISFVDKTFLRNSLEMEVNLSGGNKVIKGIGMVEWYEKIFASQEESRFSVGVSFTAISEEDRKTLADLVDKQFGSESKNEYA